MNEPNKNKCDGWQELYTLQYERISQHENQRQSFSNIVIALTVGVLAFFSSDKTINTMMTFLMVALLITVNIFAILFSKKSRKWIKFHQERAKNILTFCAPDMLDIIKSVDKPDSDKDYFRRQRIEIYLHLSLILMSITYFFISH